MISRRKFIAGAATVCVAAAVGSVSPPVRGLGLLDCIIILVVIVVGTIFIYKLIKFCRAHFSGTNALGTNIPVELRSLIAAPAPPGTRKAVLKGEAYHPSGSIDGRIKLLSGTDPKTWAEALTCSVADTGMGTVVVSLSSPDGSVVMSKTLAIQSSSEGAYAVADFSRESPAFFPAPRENEACFRLLSTQE